MDAPAVVTEAERHARAGRLAGLLYLLGALTLVPSTRLLEPAPGTEVYLLTLLAVVTGAVCLVVPWDRLSPAALHLPPLVGSIEIALVLAALGSEGSPYAALYVLVAIWAAYVFSDRRHVAVHAAFAVAMAVAALAVADGLTRPTVLQLLVWSPIVLVAAVLVTLAREHADAREQAYRRLSERDPLTGVGNYRALHERIEYEVIRHSRHGRPLTLLVLDLDGFKAVNDRHGHAEGDRLLRQVGEALTRVVRGEDTVARQGGDEFSMLAPETDAAEAPGLAERVERALAGIEAAGEPVGTTVGWASFPADGTSADDLLAHADQVLRARKRTRVG